MTKQALTDLELVIIHEAIDSFWNVECETSNVYDMAKEAVITIAKIDTVLELAEERWGTEEVRTCEHE